METGTLDIVVLIVLVDDFCATIPPAMFTAEALDVEATVVIRIIWVYPVAVVPR